MDLCFWTIADSLHYGLFGLGNADTYARTYTRLPGKRKRPFEDNGEGINLKFKGRVSRRSNCLFKDLHKFIFVPILETEREMTFKDCNYMNN